MERQLTIKKHHTLNGGEFRHPAKLGFQPDDERRSEARNLTNHAGSLTFKVNHTEV
jgi:hypothetical protein